MLLLGTCLGVHDIVSAQGLSENMEILSATSLAHPPGTNVTQGPHKVPH
jgi:hypothetical protein